MKQVIALSVLLALAGVAIGQEPNKCDAPPVWYAHMFEMNPSRQEARRAHFYYDADNERVAIREEVIEGQENITDYYLEIFLHEKGRFYRYNYKTRSCQNLTLSEPFHKMGVLGDDKYLGEASIGTLGLPLEGVRIQIYSGITERGQFTSTWIPMDHLCIPVSETTNSQTEGSTRTRQFYDVRLGLLDPDIFVPPAECRRIPPPPEAL